MNLILVIALFLASNAAIAQSKAVNVVECEKRIKQLGVAAHTAGMAWGELNEVRNLNKPHVKELEKRNQTHDAFLKAQYDAITCLYE